MKGVWEKGTIPLTPWKSLYNSGRRCSRSEHRSPIFGRQGPFCQPWLLQTTPKTYAQLPATVLAGGRWVAAAMLKAEID